MNESSETKKRSMEKVIYLPGIAEPLVAGGFWAFKDKSSKKKLRSIAKEANLEQYLGVYNSCAVHETLDTYDNRAFALFESSVAKARSLAMIMALALDQNKSYIRFFTFIDEESENKERYVWVLIVEDGLVLPDGDLIVDESHSFMLEDSYSKDYPNFDIQRISVRDTITDLLEAIESLSKKELNKTNLYSLKTNNKQVLTISGMIAVAFIVMIIGWKYYESYQQEQRKIAEKIRIEKLASQKMSALKKSEYPPVWLKEPTGYQVLDFVEEEVKHVPIFHNCWKLSHMLFDIKNKKSRMTYIKNGDMLYTEPPGEVSLKDPFRSIVTKPMVFPNSTSVNGIMKLKNAEKWIMKTTIGRPYKSSAFNLHKRQSKTVVIDKRNNIEVQVVASYQHFSFVIDDIQSLDGLKHLFNAPGLVLETIEKPLDGLWTIKGVLYVIP